MRHATAALWMTFLLVACRSPVDAHRVEREREREAYLASIVEAAASLQRPQFHPPDPGRFELVRNHTTHRATVALSIVLSHELSVTVWGWSDAPDAVTIAVLGDGVGRSPSECLSLVVVADHEALVVPAFERMPTEGDAGDGGVISARLPVATLERMAAASALRLGRCGRELDIEATQRATLGEFLRRFRAVVSADVRGAR